MTDDVVVKVYLDHIRASVQLATVEDAKRLAFRITERTQLNIRNNGQIDTGFMINSVYPIWRGGSFYGDAKRNAVAKTWSQKSKRRVDHSGHMGDQPQLLFDAAAAIVVGAVYAIYQEGMNPFLFPAVAAAANEFGGKATATYTFMVPDDTGTFQPDGTFEVDGG